MITPREQCGYKWFGKSGRPCTCSLESGHEGDHVANGNTPDEEHAARELLASNDEDTTTIKPFQVDMSIAGAHQILDTAPSALFLNLMERFEDVMYDSFDDNHFMVALHYLTLRKMNEHRDVLLATGDWISELTVEQQALWRDPQNWAELDYYAQTRDRLYAQWMTWYAARLIVKEEEWA